MKYEVKILTTFIILLAICQISKTSRPKTILWRELKEKICSDKWELMMMEDPFVEEEIESQLKVRLE